jgi:hypothetical protein
MPDRPLLKPTHFLHLAGGFPLAIWFMQAATAFLHSALTEPMLPANGTGSFPGTARTFVLFTPDKSV